MPKKKRPIDNLRDSALEMVIGTPDDRSRITGFITVGDVLLVVKEDGIYEVKLADKIDPDRTNAGVPNTNQKVLGYGSQSEWLGRTLLTANKILDKCFLPEGVNVERAVSLVFQATKDLAAMQDIAAGFLRGEARAAATLEEREGDTKSLSMPAKIDVETVCKSFIQKADHAIQKLFDVVKVFYGDAVGKHWFESFTHHIQGQHGSDDQFAQFLNDTLSFLQFVRNSRNCIEHPVDGRRQVITTDFSIDADAKIRPPTIEVIHPTSKQPPMSVSRFMSEVNEQCVGIFELMLVFMCGKHAQPFAGFDTYVMGLPEDQRREKHVRFAYCIELEGELRPIG